LKATSYRPVPVQLVGQSYERRSKALSVQKTSNLIPSRELTGGGESSLMSWYGTKAFASIAGVNRGMTKHDGVLYKVNGSTLYSVDSSGTETSLGTISGSNRCIFASDGTNLIITTGGDGYQLTGTTLTQITDTDFQNGNSCTYLSTYIWFDGNGGKFQLADSGDPDSIQPNNFATAESSPDDTIRVFAFKDDGYVFGTNTVEPYYFSGSGNPPVAKIRKGTMNIGLGAVHSVAASEQFCYFLGDDRRVYRFSALQPQNITSLGVSNQLDDIATLSDAIGFIVRIDGQVFYILNCPSGDKTFAFNEDSSAWFNLSRGASEQRYLAEDYVEIYGKKLVSWGGDIVELDQDTYTDSGTTRIQERVFGPILPSDLGIGGSRAIMRRLIFDAQSGTGLITGQGSDPQILVSASVDGGESWSVEQDVLLGRMGENGIELAFDYTQSFRTLFIRIRMSDPVFLSLFGATLEVKQAGV
jgi:hypothetical protein